MRNRLLLYLVVLIFLLIPCALLLQESFLQERLEAENRYQAVRKKIEERLEAVNRSLSPAAQVRMLVQAFHARLLGELRRNPSGSWTNLAQETFAGSFLGQAVPADIGIWAQTASGSLPLVRKPSGFGLIEGNLDRQILRYFLRNSPDDALRGRLDRQLRSVLAGSIGVREELEVGQNKLADSRETTLMTFNSPEGMRCFFWSFPEETAAAVLSSDSVRLFFCGVCDLQALGEEFPLRSIISQAESEESGVCFFRQDRPEVLASGFFQRHESLIPLLQQRFRSKPDQRPFIDSRLNLGVSEVVSFPGWIMAVAEATNQKASDRISYFLFQLILILAFLVSAFLSGEVMIFRRGPRLTVGLALLAIFVMVSFLPMAGGRFLLRLALNEDRGHRIQVLDENFEQNLENFDGGFKFVRADLIQRLNGLSRNETFFRLLRDAERPAQVKTVLSLLQKTFCPSYPFAIPTEMLLMFLWGPGIEPMGLTKTRDQLNDAPPDEVGRLVKPLMKGALQMWNPGGGVGANAAARGKAALEGEMTFDVSRAFFEGILGPSGFYHFLFEPFFAREIQGSYFRILFSSVPIFDGEWAKFLLIWFLDDWELQAGYFRGMKARGGTATGTLTLHGFRNMDLKEQMENVQEIPRDLLDLMRVSRQTGMSLSGERTDGSALIRTRVCDSLSMFIIGGTLSIQEIMQDIQWKNRVFNGVALLSLLLAFSFARRGQKYFLQPLEVIQEGFGRIRTGDFRVRLDLGRKDELGQVADSFNQMARGLEEGKILGSYVSRGVQRLVGSRKEYDAAIKGQLRLVSVIFSILLSEEEMTAENQQEGFADLGHHLNAFSEAVDRFGGEIDKVIGTKMMVFFDHESMGGPERVAEAILKVVTFVRRSISEKELDVCMGINTGFVICGVIGARSVRLDYTVVGDGVNVAARLAGVAHDIGAGAVAVSPDTRRILPGTVKTSSWGKVQLKGKSAETEVFLLL